jgi:hypothetical protein
MIEKLRKQEEEHNSEIKQLKETFLKAQEDLENEICKSYSDKCKELENQCAELKK